MKFKVLTEGGREFEVSAGDVEAAEYVAKTCLKKGESIQGIEEKVEKADEKIKVPEAEGESTEEGSSEAGEEKGEEGKRAIHADAETPVNGGIDRPKKEE